jgi:hypothetical protein
VPISCRFDKPQPDALIVLLLGLHDEQFHHQVVACRCMAFSVGHPGVQIALPSALSGCLAPHRRLRLVDYVLYGISVTANIRTRSLLSSNPPSSGSWRSCCGQAASAGRRRPIVGGLMLAFEGPGTGHGVTQALPTGKEQARSQPLLRVIQDCANSQLF